jgi:hypothetical protein
MSAHEQRMVKDPRSELPALEDTGWTREDLLDGLKNAVPLPRLIVGLATLYAPAIEPDIVATFERARAQELDPADENLLFSGAHILGGARLTSGYRPFIALLAGPHDRVEHLLGDAITATLPRILAGMFDGDAEPLLSLIADAKVDQFIRDAALRAFAFLTFDGRVQRSEAEEFLTRFEQEGMAPAGDIAWNAWVTAVALLGLERLSPRVHAAFEEERVYAEFLDEDDYGELLAAALARPADATRFEDEDLGYIEDVVQALELFPMEDVEEFPGELEEFPGGDLEDRGVDWVPGTPARNPWRDVGRNDPCPCGSGRKFKKCCLSAPP